MRPSKLIAFYERRAGRPLTPEELKAVAEARAEIRTGKRDTVKAMHRALADLIPPESNGGSANRSDSDGV